jgi:hypothetical protein
MYKIHATTARRERGSQATVILKIESSTFSCGRCDHGRVSFRTHFQRLRGLHSWSGSHGEKKNCCSWSKWNCSRLAAINLYYWPIAPVLPFSDLTSPYCRWYTRINREVKCNRLMRWCQAVSIRWYLPTFRRFVAVCRCKVNFPWRLGYYNTFMLTL